MSSELVNKINTESEMTESDSDYNSDSDNNSDSDYSSDNNYDYIYNKVYNKQNKKTKMISMKNRMYIDNQLLWKKNKKLVSENRKLDKHIRYLQLEHNNVIVDISNDNTKYKELCKNVKYYQYSNILCILFMFEYTTNFYILHTVYECFNFLSLDSSS